MNAPSQAKPCVFCRKPGASDEHVFPRWTSEIISGDGLFTTFGTGGRRTKQSKRIATITRATCIGCNTGWMSDLEQAAKPLLVPAILGQPVTWAERDRLTLATWATKTALMADRSAGDHVVSDEHFHYLHEYGRPHSSTKVSFLELHYPPGRDFVEAAIVHRKRLDLESTDVSARGYRATFAIGQLAVQVFGADDGTPDLEAERTLEINGIPIRNFLRQIWPACDEPLSWPPGSKFDANMLQLMS